MRCLCLFWLYRWSERDFPSPTKGCKVFITGCLSLDLQVDLALKSLLSAARLGKVFILFGLMGKARIGGRAFPLFFSSVSIIAVLVGVFVVGMLLIMGQWFGGLTCYFWAVFEENSCK